MTAHRDPRGDLVECRGFLFAREADGSIRGSPHCPDCGTEMLALSYLAPYVCPDCRGVTSFNVAQIGSVHRQASEEQAKRNSQT